jgi:response regulator NasT
MIAEDNELIALTLEEQLVTLGYDVVGVAHTGTEAVRMCTKLQPDIVLMDMQMPELSGDVAAKEIAKQHPTPVVMLTAYSDSDHILRAEDSGALAYLVKPVNPEELPPTIDVALARFRDIQHLRDRVDTLQETLDTRKLIERAKGILMKRRSLDGAAAETLMRQRAAERTTDIKTIAQAIVDAEVLWVTTTDTNDRRRRGN